MEDKVKLANLLCKAHNAVTEADMEDDLSYAAAIGMQADVLIANGVKIPVLCKDCKKRYTPDCIMSDGLGAAEDNDYCSYGERRTDGGRTAV